MIYGVFIQIPGGWKLIETFGSRVEADRECAYLRDTLGVAAKVFAKS